MCEERKKNMSKVIYDSMFEILKFQNDFEPKVCDMGFNFEYGSGMFGAYCQIYGIKDIGGTRENRYERD